MDICENCKWWNNGVSSALPEHEDTGRCVVNPPKINKRTGLGIWPMTEPGDTCGSHSRDAHAEMEREGEERKAETAITGCVN